MFTNLDTWYRSMTPREVQSWHQIFKGKKVLPSRRILLDRATGKLSREFGEKSFFTIWRSRLAVIHRERAEHFAFARQDRSGPAGGHSDRPCEVAILVPKRIGCDIRHDYWFASPHGSAAGTILRSDWL